LVDTRQKLEVILREMGLPGKPEDHTNVRQDLGIDSLEMLDLIFSVNKVFGIDLPLDEWADRIEAGEPEESFFRLDNFIKHIDRLRSPPQPVNPAGGLGDAARNSDR
jgi:acyl carrier protein